MVAVKRKPPTQDTFEKTAEAPAKAKKQKKVKYKK
jgi:hypothetical protein